MDVAAIAMPPKTPSKEKAWIMTAQNICGMGDACPHPALAKTANGKGWNKETECIAPHINTSSPKANLRPSECEHHETQVLTKGAAKQKRNSVLMILGIRVCRMAAMQRESIN